MRNLAVLAGVAVLASAATGASAAMRIADDAGGRIGNYVQAYSAVRNSGEQVVIDGSCLSACTLVLGIVPRSRICVTPRATLGFHAAWMPGPNGRPVHSAVGTQALWELYPANVKRWINSRGGLSSKMMVLRGRELAAMYPPCTGTQNASAPAPARVQSAGQAGKRHGGRGDVRKAAGSRVEQAREAAGGGHYYP